MRVRVRVRVVACVCACSVLRLCVLCVAGCAWCVVRGACGQKYEVRFSTAAHHIFWNGSTAHWLAGALLVTLSRCVLPLEAEVPSCDGATHSIAGIKAYNVNPMAIMTEMWHKIYDSVPAYAKPQLEEMGITCAEDYAIGFNKILAAPGADHLLYGDDMARIALAFANGSTQYASGDTVVGAPGCTYHISELYPAIYGPNPRVGAPGVGWNMTPGEETNPTINGKAAMRDPAGNFLFPGADPDGDYAPPKAAAAAAAAPAAPSVTTVTTTQTIAEASGVVKTVTTTEATPQ